MEKWDLYDKDRNKTNRIGIRGQKIHDDLYHLVVDVWIINSHGEFLLTKRSANKSFPNLWTMCGGAAIQGDSSLLAALREVEEEIGIRLRSQASQLVTSLRREDMSPKSFKDVWLFQADFSIDQVTCQPGEVQEAAWFSQDQIKEMVSDGRFIGVLRYLNKILD